MTFEVEAIVYALIGAVGLTVIVSQLIPRQPALLDALDRLGGKDEAARTAELASREPATRTELLTERVGAATLPMLDRLPFVTVPAADLAILRRSPIRWLGDKVASASIGLILPSVLNLVMSVSGFSLAWQIPAFAGIALAIVLFFVPDIEVRQKAAAAREQFRRSLGAYVELAAYCRNGGIGVKQSLETAAGVADTWVFRRLIEALAEADYANRASWAALESVGKELGIEQLTDVAHTMELSGTHGSSVYETLRAQAASMRNEMLSGEQGDANASTQKIAVPLGGLVVVFIAILVIPGFQAAF